MSWKSHIKHIQQKVSKTTAVFNRERHSLNHKALHTLYCTQVLPYLTYCAEIWDNNYISRLHQLFILQKRAMRYIHKAGYWDHTNSLFLHSKLLKFINQVAFQTGQVIFKAKHHLLPVKLQTLLRKGRSLWFKLKNVQPVWTTTTSSKGNTRKICLCNIWRRMLLNSTRC